MARVYNARSLDVFWNIVRMHELRVNWKRVKALQPLRQIAPLE